MKILVDTAIWSLALRRKKAMEDPYVKELQELIHESRVQMIGPIRQEILSGIRSEIHFESVKNRLSAFPDLQLEAADYEKAAEFFNVNRGKGVQGSNTDFLICAVSHNYQMAVLTTDKDFTLFKRNISFNLQIPRTTMT